MEFTVGTLVEGKVKSITKFGAFILLPENRTGMVHISEVSDHYVSDIHEHLNEGQTVRTKIIGIDAAGKISLSIKRAKEQSRPAPERTRAGHPPAPKPPLTFEEKLKQFMSDSDSRISGSRQYERKTKTRKR